MSVCVAALDTPIKFPLLGDTNNIQSLLSSTILTSAVILASAAASSAPEGPVRMKSIVCDSGSSARPYAVARDVFVTL